MKARTDTNCKECIHRKVCCRVDKPQRLVERIDQMADIIEEGVMPVDSEGMDTVVSCVDFEKEIPRPRPVYRKPFDNFSEEKRFPEPRKGEKNESKN